MCNGIRPTKITNIDSERFLLLDFRGLCEMAFTLTLKTLDYNIYFHQLEVVSRCRDPQLHVGENYSLLIV